MGRIGLAISPPSPDTIYAIVEATQEKGGFFRSTDAGQNWNKMSGYVAGSPQYYNELIADPVKTDRVYSMDTFMQVTEDGGKTFSRVGVKAKHVDEHALWIDPCNTDHLLTGKRWRGLRILRPGENWRYMAHIPITQFYRVAVDYDEPFYNVYGGTQDNNTQGGPSRTHYAHASPTATGTCSWAATVSSLPPTPPTQISSIASAVRLSEQVRAQQRREDRHPAPAGRGRDPQVELELGVDHQPARSPAAVLRLPEDLPQR